MLKKFSLMFCSLAMVLSLGVFAQAQTGTVAHGPDEMVARDMEAEKESRHNLEVARHYFKMKKAYRAAIARCEEIIAGYPQFSRLDEVLYIAGMSSLRLAENKGKQSAQSPAEKLRDDAREYFTRIVNDFPNSDFRKSAEDELRPLGEGRKKQ